MGALPVFGNCELREGNPLAFLLVQAQGLSLRRFLGVSAMSISNVTVVQSLTCACDTFGHSQKKFRFLGLKHHGMLW